MAAPTPNVPEPHYRRLYFNPTILDSINKDASCDADSQASRPSHGYFLRSRNNTTNSTTTPLLEMPDDVVACIMDKLDNPSRACLALTCKAMAKVSQIVDTKISRLPVLVRRHERKWKKKSKNRYTWHMPEFALLMVLLKDWMPKGFRYCWICEKYTHHSHGNGRWRTTTMIGNRKLRAIDLPALPKQDFLTLRCHEQCLIRSGQPTGHELLRLWREAMQTPWLRDQYYWKRKNRRQWRRIRKGLVIHYHARR